MMAAVQDSRAFRIPNHLSGLVMVGFLGAYLGLAVLPGVDMAPLHQWPAHLVAGLAMFLVTLLLFGLRLIGAGDAKFASALAVWFGLADLPLFIFYISLFGGVLGLLTLILKKYRPFKNAPAGTWVASAQAGQNRVPYGMAIAAGFLLTAYTAGYFDIVALFLRVENGG